MAGVGNPQRLPAFAPQIPRGAKLQIDGASERLKRDPLTKSLFRRVNIAKDVDLLNSKIWNSRIKEGVFTYESVAQKGPGAQELVNFTH